MKKVVFNKKSDEEIVVVDDIKELFELGYSVGAISEYGVKALIAWEEKDQVYKMVSIRDMEIYEMEYDNWDILAFNDDNELLDWLKVEP